jgi:predicted ATPase
VVGELLREPVTQRLFLQGLTLGDVTRFIALTAGAPMAQALSATIYTKTQGNPFFVTEMVRLLVAQGGQHGMSIPQSGMTLPLPHGVREAIGRRLNTLSARCYRVLTYACVLGREYRLDALASVSNMASAQVLATLEEAVAARIITEIPGCAGSYSFVHPLVRETLYADLSASQRVWLHRRAAEVLEEQYRAKVAFLPTTHSGLAVSELAYHFFEATRTGGAVDKAIAYAIKAGKHVTGLLAYEEAVQHYERALQLLGLHKRMTCSGVRCCCSWARRSGGRVISRQRKTPYSTLQTWREHWAQRSIWRVLPSGLPSGLLAFRQQAGLLIRSCFACSMRHSRHCHRRTARCAPRCLAA